MTNNFYGLPTRGISNKHLRLEFLAEAGPRIVRLMPNGSDENLLAEVPDLKWNTPYGDYFIWGGHRLWHAPEALPRTYIPDDGGLKIEELEGGVRLSRLEAPTGIHKSIEIHLHSERPAVKLVHSLRNDGTWPVELAPWAITQLQMGGVAVLPQQIAPLDPDGLLPNRCLALWSYTRLQDSRLHLRDDGYVLVEAQPQSQACKVGYMNRRGWLGYLRQGVFFVKRFEPRPDRPHADFDCNAEVYCKDRFIELETLGPLSRLEPGQCVTHDETWELYLNAPPGVEDARALVRDLEPGE